MQHSIRLITDYFGVIDPQSGAIFNSLVTQSGALLSPYPPTLRRKHPQRRRKASEASSRIVAPAMGWMGVAANTPTPSPPPARPEPWKIRR